MSLAEKIYTLFPDETDIPVMTEYVPTCEVRTNGHDGALAHS